MLDKTWSFTLEMFADSARTWWRIILKSGYLVHKVRHVCVLVMWKCNLTWSFKIPALFSRPWQLFWGRGKAEHFWWSHFRDRFQSTARQATACPSVGDGSQSGGTPKLTLLSVEQGHSAKATGGALWSSLLSLESFYHLLWFIDSSAVPVRWFIGLAGIISGRIVLKPTAILRGIKIQVVLLNQFTAWLHKCLCCYH